MNVISEIPCFKLVETEKTLAFLDISPLSKGHALVIPKVHGEKLTDIPDDHLTEILIPKPNATEGLGVGWPQQKTDMDKLKAYFEDIKKKL
ncbi:Adenosine 5'-monophosphoramidase [Collariella sp. IMI 366227]|nr:Adenosine 5'-monophosphoramidase [Collariella sp. IMI 366227]